MKNKLLRVSTSDGLYLHGFYAPSQDKKVAVLHLHGFEGNFYQNCFVQMLANEFEAKNIGFLTVNTRGAGKETDFQTIDGRVRRIGSRYELLEDAHLDITPWLKFLLEEGYSQIILEGHSAGALKACRYLFEGELKDKVYKLVLLSPPDTKGVMIVNGRGDIAGLLKKAQAKVDQGQGDELVTPEFEKDIMCYKTFVSWYEQNDLGRMFDFCCPDYDFPAFNKIKIPTKVIVGSKDEYFHLTNPDNPEEAMDLILRHIPNSQGKIINSATHSFEGFEEVIAREIVGFVLKS